jgi:hypothetical protein
VCVSSDEAWRCVHYLESYSRGYKNRAIVKKMLEISPIFNDDIECQLFKFMTFFDSRKDLTSKLGSIFSQSIHVGRHRRPWHHTFFFSLQYFTRCLVKIILDILKLFQWLKKWGLWPGLSNEYQRQQLWAAWAANAPSSSASWLKQMGLRTTPFLRVKNSPG